MEVYMCEPRVDARNEEDIRNKLLSLLRKNEGVLEIDMTNTEYISSAGYRALLIAAKSAIIYATKRTREQGRGMKVTNVSPDLYEQMEKIGMREILNAKGRSKE